MNHSYISWNKLFYESSCLMKSNIINCAMNIHISYWKTYICCCMSIHEHLIVIIISFMLICTILSPIHYQMKKNQISSYILSQILFKGNAVKFTLRFKIWKRNILFLLLPLHVATCYSCDNHNHVCI